MRAVLISIQPKWCELIASGKKTVEVRKTKPTGNVPFKCYIYCTKAKEHFSIGGGVYATSDTLYRLPTGEIKFGDGFELMGDWSGQYDESNFLNGKVIGEFVCKRIDEIRKRGVRYNFDYCYQSLNVFGNDDIEVEITDIRKSCIAIDDLNLYGASSDCLYAWHISDLVIYDKPKDLSEFKKAGFMTEEDWLAALYPNTHCHYEAWAKKFDITRPPQSWCYVEERSNDEKEA